MTEYVAGVPVTAIQSVEIDNSTGTEEVDLVDKNTNLVLSSASSGIDVEISLALTPDIVDGEIVNPVEDKRDQLRDVIYQDITENSIIYGDLNGYIVVEEIGLAEASDLSNYREATVTGVYFPWPKYYTDTSLPVDSGGVISARSQIEGYMLTLVLLSGNLSGSLGISGSSDIIKSTSGSIAGFIGADGDINAIKSIDGVISVENITSGELGGQYSFSGSVEGNLFHSNISYGENYGDSYGQRSIINLSAIKSISSSSNFTSTMKANADLLRAKLVDGFLNLSLTVDGEFYRKRSLSGNANSFLHSSGSIYRKRNISGSTSSKLAFQGSLDLSGYGQTYGTPYGE